MKTALNKALVAAGLILASASSQAAVMTLDFEDLSGAGNVASNYQGLTWDSNWMHYDMPQSPYYASSGSQRIYTHNYGGWIDFGEDVTFLGSWIASADVNQEMYWEGYDDGVKLFESAHLYGGVQTMMNLNWAEVDYVKFVSSTYNHFILDDIKYDTNVSAVPLPAAAWLFGSGLLGLAAMTRRRKAQAIA